MIHYTLLPDKEIKTLKREYRTRLFIFLLFFMSVAVFVGIISLAPAFIFSYYEENGALNSLAEIQNSRKDNGTKVIIKELTETKTILSKIDTHKDSIVYSGVISKILGYKPAGVSIISFDINATGDVASSTIIAVVQGKSVSRESLVAFKNKLSSDPLVAGVELPVSDLAKSKDISYSIKITINQTI